MIPVLAVVFTFLGIALGSPAADLRARLGDPIHVEATKVSRTASYLRPDDASGVLNVTERDGVVFAVEFARERAEPTPGPSDRYGVTIGMSARAVRAKRGKPNFETVNTLLYPEDAREDASIIYRFDGDTLEAIKLIGSGTSAVGSAGLAHLAETSGDSYANAILDVSPSVFASDHFRDRYLTVHGCDPAGRSSTIDHRAGRTYAIVGASCNDTKRTFYFDVTRAQP